MLRITHISCLFTLWWKVKRLRCWISIEAPSNQFCWPRKSKGLRLLAVSRALLSLSVSFADGLHPILLMCTLVRIPFFFSRRQFLRLSTCLSRFPCLSLSIPPFSALQRLHPPEQRLDLVHRYGSTVKIRQWPKTSIFRFLHREEKTGNVGERYRQPLKDRINKMESKVVECFWYADQTSGWCYVQHFKVI